MANDDGDKYVVQVFVFECMSVFVFVCVCERERLQLSLFQTLVSCSRAMYLDPNSWGGSNT